MNRTRRALFASLCLLALILVIPVVLTWREVASDLLSCLTRYTHGLYLSYMAYEGVYDLEPFEWIILGIGFAIGSLLGANRKKIVRSASRGYLTLEEKAKQTQERVGRMSANVRAKAQDAITEVRYERNAPGKAATTRRTRRPGSAETQPQKPTTQKRRGRPPRQQPREE